jgi:hypothetical protein
MNWEEIVSESFATIIVKILRPNNKTEEVDVSDKFGNMPEAMFVKNILPKMKKATSDAGKGLVTAYTFTTKKLPRGDAEFACTKCKKKFKDSELIWKKGKMRFGGRTVDVDDPYCKKCDYIMRISSGGEGYD